MRKLVFTMVKDEEDIVNDWVIYHGSMFGFENLYIIDNYSTDGTYEKLLEFNNQNIPINIIRKKTYLNKGNFMTDLISKYSDKEDFCFPIDIDEFIVFYDKDTNELSVDKIKIITYIDNLPESKVYKTNYIQGKITNSSGYSRATVECNYGEYSDNGTHAKSFIKPINFNKIIDHGNHINNLKNEDYFFTNLCLIHFHQRNMNQMLKKIYNNVSGLNYNTENIESLKEEIIKNPRCQGNHHIRNLINVLENNYSLDFRNVESHFIDLSEFNTLILEGYF
jgi:hypothetical protein